VPPAKKKQPAKTTAPAKKTVAKKPPAAKKKTAPPVRIPKRPTAPDRIPRVVENPTLDDHLAVITRAVMQAGLSWAFIDSRWDDYVRAFDNFNCRRVAEYGEADIERLMTTDGIIHSKSKIEGTIKNARTLIALEAEFGSLRAYHNSFATYDDARKDAKQRFAFMGDLNTYYWRFRTGASVPDFEEWMKGQERDHPRMREMVTLGASRLGAGRSLMR
jgi:3-methyladenine DNA glycosylase Tag